MKAELPCPWCQGRGCPNCRKAAIDGVHPTSWIPDAFEWVFERPIVGVSPIDTCVTREQLRRRIRGIPVTR
jgi:hypothetical protein